MIQFEALGLFCPFFPVPLLEKVKSSFVFDLLGSTKYKTIAALCKSEVTRDKDVVHFPHDISYPSPASDRFCSVSNKPYLRLNSLVRTRKIGCCATSVVYHSKGHFNQPLVPGFFRAISLNAAPSRQSVSSSATNRGGECPSGMIVILVNGWPGKLFRFRSGEATNGTQVRQSHLSRLAVFGAENYAPLPTAETPVSIPQITPILEISSDTYK